MTRARRPAVALVLLSATGLVLAGCGGDDDESGRLSRAQGASSSTTADDSESAEKQAAYRVHQYVTGTSTIMKQPGAYRDPGSIGFAEKKLATRIIVESLELEDKKRKQVGDATVTADPKVTDVELSPPKKDGAQPAPYVQLTACVDESKTHLVDAKGKKVKKSEGRGPHPVKFHVINRQWPSKTTWQVSWTKPIRGAC